MIVTGADTGSGPLRPGKVGRVVETDDSAVPYKVACDGREWWYPAEALVAVSAGTSHAVQDCFVFEFVPLWYL